MNRHEFKVCNKRFAIEEVIVGEEGDFLEVTAAKPTAGETSDDVDGYCDILNKRTGITTGTIWNEVDGNSVLDEIIFAWEMTNDQWTALAENNKRKDDETLDKDYELYGRCLIGHVCAEILHTHDFDDWYAFANIYAQGIDDGYGETDEGIPYALLDDGPGVPLDATTFEEFKVRFESEFIGYITQNDKALPLATKSLAKW